MKCPVCKSILIHRKIAENEMFSCPEKHGISINVGELGDVIRLLALQSETPHAEIKDVFHLTGPVRAVDEERNCPECGLKMTTFNYAYNSNIFLDRCNECDNVWIDAEEFPKLLSYVKGNPKIDSLTSAISEYGAEKIAEKEAVENMKISSRSRYYGYRPSLLDYIERKLSSKRTPLLTKIFWIIIIIILLGLYALYQFLRHH